MEKFMMIDGNSIINRAFYGVPLLTNAEGKYTNAVYGFLNILFKLLEEEKPKYLAVAFDLKAPTFRHKTFEQYKGTRKGMPQELLEQMPILKQVLKAMHIKQYAIEGFEADDILGTLSKKAEQEGMQAVIVSGDRDLLQLASDTLKVRIPKTKGGKTEIEDYFAKDVLQKYGVTPEELIDVKALMGDTSDNVPGVPSIGEKTAIKIIQQYKNIETAIEHFQEIKPKKASENLNAFQQQAKLSKYLVTIVRDVPLQLDKQEVSIQDMFTQEAYLLMKNLGFKSLLPRFAPEKAKQEQTIAYQRMTEKRQWKQIFDTLQKQKEIAYILLHENGMILGMSLYDGKGTVFFLECEQKEIPILLNCAKEFLQNPDYLKIAHDAKKDIKLLRQYNITLSDVCFDTAIAAYLLNSTEDSYEYDAIAEEFLQKIYPSEEELLGKGKSKKSLLDLQQQQRTLYAARQAEVTYLAKAVMAEKLKQNEQEQLYYSIELPLIRVLADMEKYGIKVDKKALEEYGEKLQKSIDTLTLEIYTFSGVKFNINSPKQLGEILFSEEYMALPGAKKTKTGYSTAAEVLEKLKGQHPIIEKILQYRQLTKLKSTYVDGLLTVMDTDTQKIYSTFHQTITATGRISSTEPNLQNIPIRLELGRELRKVFIPTDENYCFLDGDYSQIELRVLAHIAQDKTLIEAFCNNQDIHSLTASQVFHVPFEEVTPLQRRNAKAVNFGIIYGIGAFSLSQDLNITRKEAEKYIAGYFAKYPNIKAYMDKTVQYAEKNGYVETLFHRRRAMPELQAKTFAQRSFGERVAMNMPIQGTAADIIKIAMIQVHKKLQQASLRARLILQVHDELLLEVHKDDAKQAAFLLKETMENAVSLDVPMVVEVHQGNSWFETK
ncbi:MAG TPA: DNA polymerase I [Candidatus Coprocola pullicola]|nr:DNA polymerase I [Candidatus Coprocola pullicola]